MEAVRLIDGQEYSTVKKKDIAALLESLCEHPLADGRTEASPELEAFRWEAARALSQAGGPRSEADDMAGADRLTAALATLLSGTDTQAVRRTVEEAALRSAAVRLDAQSAFAFVDAVENPPQSAPMHLIDALLAADEAGAVRPAVSRQRAETANIWSLIAGGSWPARRWRLAAACTVMLLAGMTSVYRLQTNPALEGSPVSPVVNTSGEQPALADAPDRLRSVVTTIMPCELPRPMAESVDVQSIAPAGLPPEADAPAAADCAPAPGREFADRPADEIEAIAARRQAEAAREAAAVRGAAKVGAAQAGPTSNGGLIRADRSGPVFGPTDRTRPAAARVAPAAAPATRPAAPAAVR